MKKFFIIPAVTALLLTGCGNSNEEINSADSEKSIASSSAVTTSETSTEKVTEVQKQTTATTAVKKSKATESKSEETTQTVTTAQKTQEIKVSLPSVSGTVSGDGNNFSLVLSGDFAYAKVTLFNSTNNTSTDAGQFSNDGNPILLPVDSDGTWYAYIIPYSSDGTEGLTATAEFVRETQQPPQQDVQPVQDTSWKTVYSNLANVLKDSYEQYRYFLLYINDDDIPELAVMNKYDKGSLYTVVDGSLVTVHSWENIKQSGLWSYMPRQNLFSTHYYNSAYSTATTVRKINPDGSSEIVETAGFEYDHYFVNDNDNATESEVENFANEVHQSYTYIYDSYYDVDTLYSMLT